MYKKIPGFIEAYIKHGYTTIATNEKISRVLEKREGFKNLGKVDIETHINFWKDVNSSLPLEEWESLVRKNLADNPEIKLYKVIFD